MHECTSVRHSRGASRSPEQLVAKVDLCAGTTGVRKDSVFSRCHDMLQRAGRVVLPSKAGLPARLPARAHRARKHVGRLLRWPSRLWDRHARRRVLERRVCYVAGPETIDCGRDEVIAICVVRNGALHVRSFIEHHFALGVRHVVFMDNGSTDDTVRIAAAYPNVTILRTTCPYRTHENAMKRYLVERFAQHRWSLCVDIDERFHYPFSDVLPLRSLLTYLNEHSYTAVVAQMLDMFSDEGVIGADRGNNRKIPEGYTYYDISNIQKTDYPYGILSNEQVRMHWGGIRGSLFGTRNGLTKAALIFLDGVLEPFVSWHHAWRARIADFTCLLLHYPFAGSFQKKVADAVATRMYGRLVSREYRKYWRILERNPDLAIKGDTVRKLESVDVLIDEGFLVVSESYRRWAKIHAEKGTA